MTSPEPPGEPVRPEVISSSPPPQPAATPDPSDLAAALGGLDMGALLQQAQSMQASLIEAQAQAAEQPIEGQAGRGLIRIQATAGLEFKAVHIKPEAIEGASAEDVEMLEDLILVALRDVVSQANEVSAEALGGLGNLGGLLG